MQHPIIFGALAYPEKGALKKNLHQQPQKKKKMIQFLFCGCWCKFFFNAPFPEPVRSRGDFSRYTCSWRSFFIFFVFEKQTLMR